VKISLCDALPIAGTARGGRSAPPKAGPLRDVSRDHKKSREPARGEHSFARESLAKTKLGGRAAEM
jgi:hypothetical protein